MHDHCEQCGDPRPDNGPVRVNGKLMYLCPACEDLVHAAQNHDYPPGDPTGAGRIPPHGNTTR